MGQDSWNLMYGQRHNPKTRRGTQVDMHPDEGYGGPKMIPGYAGAYKNSKERTIGLKANGNPKSLGSERTKKSTRYSEENGELKRTSTKRRK